MFAKIYAITPWNVIICRSFVAKLHFCFVVLSCAVMVFHFSNSETVNHLVLNWLKTGETENEYVFFNEIWCDNEAVKRTKFFYGSLFPIKISGAYYADYSVSECVRPGIH